MAKYSDLLIDQDGIAADVAGMPIWIYDRDVVKQDIAHALRESGLLERLIGERQRNMQALIFKKIRMLIESDLRVKPGSSSITPEKGTLHIHADTEFGPITMGAIL